MARGAYYQYDETPISSTGPKWHPRNWGKLGWAIAAGVLAVILVIVIPVGVVVSRNNRNNKYPSYTSVSYALKDTYSGETFFDKFDYFTGYDPTNGFVHYVPNATAQSLNLTYASSSSAVLRVDTSVGNTSEPDASTGRFSVRLTSKTQYDNGLFIFDVKHSPFGCGTWPALWLSDPNNWPDHGEIDIMEAVNKATSGNLVSLHTTNECTMKSVKRKMTGDAQGLNCYNGTNGNEGCNVEGAVDTFGSSYNDNGGGTVAVEWRDAGIRVWQFSSSQLPSDISSGNPDPSTWGEALADFPSTKCDISSHFTNMSIIANIDLCGSLTEAKYATSGCPLPCVGDHTCIGGTSPTNCTDYVANNPDAFTDAFWEFGSFQVYQQS